MVKLNSNRAKIKVFAWQLFLSAIKVRRLALRSDTLKSLLLIAAIMMSSNSVSGEEVMYTTKLYAEGTSLSEQVYNGISLQKVEKGQRVEINRFYYGDKQEEVAVEEVVTFAGPEVNAELKKYLVKHHQLKENWQIDIKSGQLHFTKTEWGSDEVEKDDEAKRGHFVVGPLVRRLLKEQWAKILDGETVKIRFAVPARKETVGFKIYRYPDREIKGEDFVILKMKPSSFFIALLVDPFYMKVSKDGSEIIQMTGFNLPRKNIKGKWKDAMVDTVFHYPKKKTVVKAALKDQEQKNRQEESQ